jgi:hypothetical protein
VIRILSALAFLLFPVLAAGHEREVDTCATQVPETCLLAFELPGLSLQNVDPVFLRDGRLRLLAASPDGEVELVDFSMTDGLVTRRQVIDLRLEPDAHFWGSVFAEFSGDGQTVVIAATEQDDELGFRLFDADGNRIGFLPDRELEANFLSSDLIKDDWRYDDTAADLFALLIAQNLVQLQGNVLTGTLYRFDLVADLGKGTFELRETRPAMNEADSFAAYMKRRFALQLDPVGRESRHYHGDIAAVTSVASDGSASAVFALDPNQHRVSYDQHLGVENGWYFDYGGARLSPDGQHLAVLRSSSSETDGPPLALMAFRTVTANEVFVAALPPMEWNSRARLVWLSDSRIAVLQTDEEAGIKGFAFDLPEAD